MSFTWPRCTTHVLKGNPSYRFQCLILPCRFTFNEVTWQPTETRDAGRPTPNVRLGRLKVGYRLVPAPEKPRIGLFGAPLVYGQPLTGGDAAPELLRDSHLLEKLTVKGANVTDFGDLTFTKVLDDGEVVSGCKNAKAVGLANRQIADKVCEILNSGRKGLVLGGDHSVALGSVFGHTTTYQDAALIWVDAHADINTPLTSRSGNLHGMPVSFLVKELPHFSPPVPGLEWITPCISADQLAYIGLRCIDPKEREFIRDLGICAFSANDVRRFGIDCVIKTALKRIDPQGKRPLHLSFDVDALDPELMPATGIRVEHGLTLCEALAIVHNIFLTGRLSVMDLVELNPLVTSKSQAYWSADVAVEIIVRAFCGKRQRIPLEKQQHSREEQKLPSFRGKGQDITIFK